VAGRRLRHIDLCCIFASCASRQKGIDGSSSFERLEEPQMSRVLWLTRRPSSTPEARTLRRGYRRSRYAEAFWAGCAYSGGAGVDADEVVEVDWQPSQLAPRSHQQYERRRAAAGEDPSGTCPFLSLATVAPRRRPSAPVALSSAASTDVARLDLAAFRRTAPGDDLDLRALRARCKNQNLSTTRHGKGSAQHNARNERQSVAVAITSSRPPRRDRGAKRPTPQRRRLRAAAASFDRP
jgi:hypothetical protein